MAEETLFNGLYNIPHGADIVRYLFDKGKATYPHLCMCAIANGISKEALIVRYPQYKAGIEREWRISQADYNEQCFRFLVNGLLARRAEVCR